ncbi:integrase core domain-containing protein [Salmonella enterica]|uniref:integrase core domain-containing protein n=1 Tax=Salmonella enterica TaxID=28901 RepID=UPI00391A43DE
MFIRRFTDKKLSTYIRTSHAAQAREIVKESVAIYNHERPHLALKYKTPDDVHQAFYRQKTVNLYQD